MEIKLKINILIIGILLVLSSISVLSSSISHDKENYALTESLSITGNCAGNEKNQDYTLNITNFTGTQVNFPIITGNTGDCTTFLNTFIINSTYIDAYGTGINSTLSGTNLEGAANSSVSTAGSNILLISSITHQGAFLQLSSSIDSNVADENGNAISGGLCDANVEDPSNDQVLFTIRSPMIDGNLDFIWTLAYERFKEPKDYVAKISCFCGSEKSDNECFSDDPLVNASVLAGSIGSTDVAFRTSEWLKFHQNPLNTTLINGTLNSNASFVAGYDTIYFVTNVSNNNPDNEPIEVKLRTFLVNEETGKIFGIPNEGQLGTGFAGLGAGNTSAIASHLISKDAVTGVYHITAVYDVKYKNLFQVAQYIILTEPFDIISVEDTLKINDVEVHDFFGEEVKLNANIQGFPILPNATNTTPHVVLAEAFGFDFCLNMNNTRNKDIQVFFDELLLENSILNTSELILSEVTFGDQQVVELGANANNTEFCIPLQMPEPLATHSDYRISFNIHIGEESESFECGEACEFDGHTDYFYIGSLDDMIELPKFITKPTPSALSNPGIYIVTERGGYIKNFDDVNYTSQENIDWGNSTVSCTEKDSDTKQLCDYSIFPRAGEKIKACFQGRNHFSAEMFLDMFNVYIDSDVGDSVHVLISEDKHVEIAVKSISDNDLYNASARSRSLEADGNLVDGYFTACLNWMELPDDLVGSNNWDIQGHAKLDPDIYSLKVQKSFTWESDEFLAYGLIQSEPTWDLHLFDPIHYRIPEKWNKLSSTVYTFDLNISYLGPNAQSFNFGEHLPFRLLDENTPLERLVNATVTYNNGTAIPYKTELFTQFEQIILLIENINTSLGDNNLTFRAETYDFANRSVVALEDIADKTGTFRAVIDCPVEGTLGGEIKCILTVQLEETQLVKEEAGFTCFLLSDGVRHSTKKFERQVTKDGFSEAIGFLIPSSFSGDSQIRAECKVVHYDLGGREDTIFDTFVTKLQEPRGGQEGAVGPGAIIENEKPPFLESISQAVQNVRNGIIEAIEKVPIPFLLLIISGMMILTSIDLRNKAKVIKPFVFSVALSIAGVSLVMLTGMNFQPTLVKIGAYISETDQVLYGGATLALVGTIIIYLIQNYKKLVKYNVRSRKVYR